MAHPYSFSVAKSGFKPRALQAQNCQSPLRSPIRPPELTRACRQSGKGTMLSTGQVSREGSSERRRDPPPPPLGGMKHLMGQTKVLETQPRPALSSDSNGQSGVHSLSLLQDRTCHHSGPGDMGGGNKHPMTLPGSLCRMPLPFALSLAPASTHCPALPCSSLQLRRKTAETRTGWDSVLH